MTVLERALLNAQKVAIELATSDLEVPPDELVRMEEMGDALRRLLLWSEKEQMDALILFLDQFTTRVARRAAKMGWTPKVTA